MIAAIVLVAVSQRISARGATDSFPQPEVRRSVSGVLRTPLRAAVTANVISDAAGGVSHRVTTPTFEGTIRSSTRTSA